MLRRARTLLRAWIAEAILWGLRRYFTGRACDLETNKAVMEGRITGSRVEYDPEGVPRDLTLFWASDGLSDFESTRRASFTRLRRTPQGGWVIHE